MALSKPQKDRRSSIKGKGKLAMTATALLIVSVISLAACAPAANNSNSDNDANSQQMAEEESFSTAADFTKRSTGLYPDVQTNAEYQNSGNRGCSACHDNLFDLDKDNGTYTHITTYIGLKKATYNGDCVVCHFSKTGTAGNIMSENIHVLHYSDSQFVNANGNCWSCHVTDTNESGEIVLKLFEDVQYDGTYGGYPDAITNAGTPEWVERRGWESGFLSGVSVISEPDIKVDVDQNASEEEDEFLIMNYRRIDENDQYADIDPETWSLEVTGVGKPGSYTLEDLKAMPQTEYTATQWCLVAGYNTAMVDNMPMKGVLLRDFIEAVGGIDDGINTITPVSADQWTAIFPGGSTDLQSYIDNNAMIVLENYGHDLTIPQGGPAKIFVPGTGGTVTVKNLTELRFETSDNPPKVDTTAQGFIDANKAIDINTSWFDNDGVTGKVGETLALEGASYGWSFGDLDHAIDKVLISFDYGLNWTEIDAPDEFDPDQWVHFTVNWTPSEAGTYIVKAKAVDKNGIEQGTDSNLIVVVGE